MVRNFAFALVFGLTWLAAGGGCHSAKAPELRVLGAQTLAGAARHDVLFVQVTNPASRPMRLTKLVYTFAADGATVFEGEVKLAREVPAGSAVVVEIPLESSPSQPMTMRGELTTERDQIVRIFAVSAQVQAR